METSTRVTDQQKESAALSTMRLMLSHYAERHHISFEEAFYQFVNSAAYEALFDFETGIWREGPDYLEYIFDETKAKAQSNMQPSL